MPNITTILYTQKNINEIVLVRNFFKILDKAGLKPEKIGPFEPLKEVYSLDRAVEMWNTEEPGCYEDGLGMVGKAGGMIGKVRKPNFRFMRDRFTIDINQWYLIPGNCLLLPRATTDVLC